VTKVAASDPVGTGDKVVVALAGRLVLLEAMLFEEAGTDIDRVVLWVGETFS